MADSGTRGGSAESAPSEPPAFLPLAPDPDARVLVVDDDPAIVRALERVLGHGGYRRVYSTTDPLEAIERFEAESPDAVLLDLFMPHMDGFEVMSGLRATVPDDVYLPIIVLTGDADPDTRQRALTGGATDFLTKPFEYTEVLARLRNVLETRRLHERVRLHNRTLEARVRERTRDLERARNETVRRLAIAAEYRDDATGRHAARVGELAALLARELGLTENEVELLRRAAPLHDVGKIGIPDSILLKPGRLSPEEFEVMKSHVRIGAEILGGGEYPTLQLAETIALNHHEQWSGKGYLGLSGPAIPLVGRIVSVADVFDSVRHERPYKPSVPHDRAVAEVRQGAGSQFDPEIVEAFLMLDQNGDIEPVEHLQHGLS